MDIGYKKDEIGTFTTIATLTTVLFSNFSTSSDDLATFIFNPGAAEVLLGHLGDGFIPKRCDELDRFLRV